MSITVRLLDTGKRIEVDSFFDGHTHIPIFPRGIEGGYQNNQWVGKSK